MPPTQNKQPLNRRIKTLGKRLICAVLEAQVRWLRAKHDFKVIAVVGSVGKTGTKLAVARMLSVRLRVRYQDGNYNDRLTVPLIVFGHQQPRLFDVWQWLKIFYNNQRQIRGNFAEEVVIVELGTDGPGQIAAFSYLQPDLTIVTGIAAEHMEFFGTLDAVAAEELSVAAFSKALLINLDETPKPYIAKLTYRGYGVDQLADYRLSGLKQNDDLSQTVSLTLLGNSEPLVVNIKLLGAQGAKMVLAAAAVAKMYGIEDTAIITGLAAQTPIPGRMQPLPGTNKTFLIDDTYNASPTSMMAALQMLYSVRAPQRIAVLGSMNELGGFSREAHQQVGNFCDPAQLDHLVTIGHDAEAFLAPAAKERGCQVKSFKSPYEAGKFVKSLVRPGAVVLVKGSQNGVFAEEAVKQLLAEEADAGKLVRQSAHWLELKKQQFSDPQDLVDQPTEFMRQKAQKPPTTLPPQS